LSQHLIRQAHDCNSEQFPTKYRVSSTCLEYLGGARQVYPAPRLLAEFLSEEQPSFCSSFLLQSLQSIQENEILQVEA
jgi:hypothetical protein